MGVEVDIGHERMTLTAADRTVGVWPLEALEISSRSDGFHIRVDGEEMVLNVTDSKRFAAELGVEQRPRRAAVAKPVQPREVQSSSAGNRTSPSKANGAIKSPGPASSNRPEPRQPDLQDRISEIGTALRTDSVTPAEAFAEWLKLLKELNRLHGEGSMTSDLFYQLNTQLLDLISEPVPDPV
jgi:hypothetical protein